MMIFIELSSDRCKTGQLFSGLQDRETGKHTFPGLKAEQMCNEGS